MTTNAPEAELARIEFERHVRPRIERTPTAQADFDRRVRANLEAIGRP